MPTCAGFMGTLDPNNYQAMPPHGDLVTALDSVGDHGLVSSSADASVCYWDVRKATGGPSLNIVQPVSRLAMDGQAVITVASRNSPLPGLIAISTSNSLFTADVSQPHFGQGSAFRPFFCNPYIAPGLQASDPSLPPSCFTYLIWGPGGCLYGARSDQQCLDVMQCVQTQ